MKAVYLEITSALSAYFKTDRGDKFQKLAQEATDFHELDNGNCCFLWENVSPDQVVILKEVLYSCNDEHYHVVFNDVKRHLATHYGSLYNLDEGLNIDIKLSIKKD